MLGGILCAQGSRPQATHVAALRLPLLYFTLLLYAWQGRKQKSFLPFASIRLLLRRHCQVRCTMKHVLGGVRMTDAERDEVQQMIRRAIHAERMTQVDDLRDVVGKLRARADDTQAQQAMYRAYVTGAFILESYADALAHRNTEA